MWKWWLVLCSIKFASLKSMEISLRFIVKEILWIVADSKFKPSSIQNGRWRRKEEKSKKKWCHLARLITFFLFANTHTKHLRLRLMILYAPFVWYRAWANMSLNKNIGPHGQRILKVQKRAHIKYIHTILLLIYFLFSFSQKDGKNFGTKLKQIHSVQTPLNVIETVRNDALSWHNIRSFEFIQLVFNSWGQFSRRLILFQQLFVMDMDEKKLQTAAKKRL